MTDGSIGEIGNSSCLVAVVVRMTRYCRRSNCRQSRVKGADELVTELAISRQ